MANIGENTFFVYDTSINKKEEDDPQDAIVYFRPDNVSIDQQCMLSGQLVGAISFIGSISKSPPSVITMKNVKFAIAYEGVYIIALAGSLKLQNKTLKSRLAALYRLFVLFHGSITKIQQESLNRDFFLCAMKDIWSCYLSFIHRHGNSVLSLFESIPTLNIPKSMGSIFLRSCHILQNCRRHHGVLSGCILYKNRILCNEFPTQLVSSLLIKAVKKYGHMSFLAADTDFPLPRGISIIPIYLRPDEFETVSLKKLEVPLTSQLPASISQQSPSPSKQLPSASQQLPSTSQQLPSPSQQSSSTSQQLTSTSQQSPSTSQQSPSPSQQLPSTSQQSDSTSQHLDSTSQQSPSTSQQLPSPSQQSESESVSSNILTDKIPTSVKDSECIHPSTNDQNKIQNENVQFDKVGIQHRNIETNKSDGRVESINSNNSDDCTKYSTEQETVEKGVSCIQNGFNHDNFVRIEKVNYIEMNEEKECPPALEITLKKRSASVDLADQVSDSNCKVTTDIPHLQTLKIANQGLKSLPTSNRNQEFVSSNKTPLLQFKDHDSTSSSDRNNSVALDASESLANKDKNCVALDQSDGQDFKHSAEYNSVVEHSSGTTKEKEQKCVSGERETDSEVYADSFEPCYEQRESSMVSNTRREFKKCSLYVQAHSEMVVLIIMDYKLRDDAHVINKLWKMVLPVLGELEAELNEVPVPDTPLTMDETKNYRFLKVNQRDQKLESLNYKLTNHASSVQLAKHVFTENPSITDLTLRSSESVIYGHKIGTLQTYIEPISMIWPIKGIPSPKDKDFCLEQKTRKRLHCEPNINVI
ncbi:uncharacterized protein [Antedon mediterranea]|uniref:uncharacterized protein n=1 Tax=Antedon mediterranea TaxID=105859 RepID=UPI003AF8BED4